MKIRVGLGYDIHKFSAAEGDNKIIVCGIEIPCKYSIVAHSDGDLGFHAATDAILACIGAGDIGYYFPPTDTNWKNADSSIFIKHSLELLDKHNAKLNNLGLTLIGHEPKINMYRDKIRQNLAAITGLDIDDVNIGATTTEKLGFIGREEGIACKAIASVIIK